LFVLVFKLFEELLAVASIEAPFALLEKPIKVLLFDAVDVVSLIGEELRVVDAAMMAV
jgi:hypothetical protein